MVLRNSDGPELFVRAKFGREHGDETVDRLTVGRLHRTCPRGQGGGPGPVGDAAGTVGEWGPEPVIVVGCRACKE